MESIALSAALKYRSLEVPDSLAADQAANVDYAQYGRAYLQKLVQLQLELPPARPDLLRKMLYDDLADAQSASSGGLEKSQKVVVRFGVGLVAVAASILSLGYALPPELLAGAVGVGGVGAGFASRFFEQRQERRAQKLAGEDRQKIDDAIGGVPAGITVYEAIDKVTQETGLNASKVRDRVFGEVMAGIVAPADKWVYGVMPRRPRAAKRLLNRVHLMISVAIGRGLFLVRDIENNKRRVNRVCKWLIICERWPAVARLAQSDIRKINVLEKATTSERLTKILKENNVTHVDDINDLYKLLQHSPKFGAIDDLVFLAGLPGEAFVPDGWPVTGNSAKSAKKPSVLWQGRSSRSVKN